MSLFSLFRRRVDPRGTLIGTDTDRLAAYTKYYRAYRGYSVREPTAGSYTGEGPRLRFNFNRPIVNLAAAFMAAKPLDWEVKANPEATTACYDIWQRSGSDRTLLSAARAGGIYGELAALATVDEAGLPRIEFVDPGICFPVFDSSDVSKLIQLEITFTRLEFREGRDPLEIERREFYSPTELTVYEDGKIIDVRPYDRIPAAWIQNLGVMGVAQGISDLEGVIELVEEYDHLAGKQTRIVDYYSSPTLVFKGISAGDLNKDVRTILFLPADGEASFLEWSGSGPDVEAQLSRIRDAIAEMAQVPAVAFGQPETGGSNISGVALEILYGPLLAKTRDKRAGWSPPLEYVMGVALGAANHDVPPEDVRAIWADALPVHGQEQIAQETEAVAAGLRSKRTAMNRLGTEDPEAELKRILVEKELEGLAGAPPPPVDMLKAAKGAKGGSAEALVPSVFSANVAQQVPGGAAAGEPGPEESIADLLAQFDALVEAEAINLEEE